MNSKKATVVVLDEDMILEIVVRLPLKCAVSCTILNKNLFRLISQRKKALVSSAYPDIEGSFFCRYNDKTFKSITSGSSAISVTIPERYDPENPIILDSCNGVLLLNFLKQRRICVFNPITGGIMPVSTLVKLNLSKVTIALAVDLDAQTVFQFKLVVAERFSPHEEEDETLWRFTVLVPTVGTSWLIKSPVELICRGDSYDSCESCQFVYVHGCVYWADELNNSIIMFDVEKEKARSIDWPQCAEDGSFLFGSSDGLLHSVTLEDEFKIHSYDQVEDEWQLKHTFPTIVFNPVVLLCNGQHLLIADDPSKGMYPLHHKVEKALLMYDILSDKWEKISLEDFSFDIYNLNTYFSFVPTLAKVSDRYLHDPNTEFAEVYLRGLQRLVMQKTHVQVIE